MKVAFDIATYPLIRNNDLFYPGVASMLAIIRCGGDAVIFHSKGSATALEKRLIKKLMKSFPGRIIYAQDADGADMRLS